jgi:membrane protease YdiL (CAAX protease family)
MSARSIFRTIEFLIIFIGIPLVFYFDLLPIQKIVALLIVTIGCVVILWVDDSYDFKRLTYRPDIPGMWSKLLKKAALVAAGVLVLTIVVQPNTLFALPREQPILWGIILVLYPVLSALPQELVYREFFFHRYETLIRPEWVLIAASACSFAFLHVVYDNEWAIILTLTGGFMFARTFKETRSLYWVSVEHALYGCIVFSIGLANFFYEPF